MKIFIYKSIIIFFLFILGFYLTFGYVKRELLNEIDQLTSKENIEYLKKNLKDQMKIAINKEKFINDEDSKLINDFLNKIENDLNN
jgi:hypothetical protein|tara:strand:- start:331 stop:588 length:258 start_codon:yes stop_codon:yes gene_type:complete